MFVYDVATVLLYHHGIQFINTFWTPNACIFFNC